MNTSLSTSLAWCARHVPRTSRRPTLCRNWWIGALVPRAGQFLINGGKALAAMEGRFSVAVEDVRKIAIPVLRHRISTNFQAQAEGMTNEDVITSTAGPDPGTGDSKFKES